jgi:hypothetical protein
MATSITMPESSAGSVDSFASFALVVMRPTPNISTRDPSRSAARLTMTNDPGVVGHARTRSFPITAANVVGFEKARLTWDGGAVTKHPGHAVLVVPVPELEPFVRERWAHYEPGWVSSDPAFTHAHVTVLAPFLGAPSDAELHRVGEIAAATAPFDYVLGEVEEFPNGCIHVRPDPAAPFVVLTHALWAAFPQCPPYAGEYAVFPHVTLDQESATVSVATARAALADVLPAWCRADRLELQWYEDGGCRVVADWKLSG